MTALRAFRQMPVIDRNRANRAASKEAAEMVITKLRRTGSFTSVQLLAIGHVVDRVANGLVRNGDVGTLKEAGFDADEAQAIVEMIERQLLS